MTQKNFSIREAVAFGWTRTQKHLGLLVLVTVIGLVVVGGTSFAPEKLFPENHIAANGFFLIQLVVETIISIGFLKICLNLIDRKAASVNDLFGHINYFPSMFVAMLLTMLYVTAGILLLIVPGVIWSIRLMFTPSFVVDKNMPPLKAIKASWTLTKGITWRLFLFGLVEGLVVLLGVLFFGIGVLVAIPVVYMANTYVYRKLLEQSKSAAS